MFDSTFLTIDRFSQTTTTRTANDESATSNHDSSGVLSDSSANDSQKFSLLEVSRISLEHGSLSDSGISDSGSEQELSERERRLAALRRLTRSLETQLEPGSEALQGLWKRVEEAEAELRLLQEQCRELIVRTAASVEMKAAPSEVDVPEVRPVPR